MKIIGISGSPRKNGTTFKMLKHAMDHINSNFNNIDTEIINLSEFNIQGCISCGKCYKELSCSQNDDFIKLVDILKDKEIKGIIIATPVYMGSMTAQCKAFLDRTVMFRRNGFLFKNLIGGALAIGGSRNGGQEITIQTLHAAMLIHDMIIVGDGNKTSHFGGIMHNNKQSDSDDTVGLQTVENLSFRIAELCASQQF